jgi:hypothetical protein
MAADARAMADRGRATGAPIMPLAAGTLNRARFVVRPGR